MTANSIKKIVLDLLPLEKPDTVLDSLGQYWRRTKADGDTRLGEYSTARTDVSAYEMDLILDWCKKRQNKSAQTPPSVSKPKTTTHNPNPQPSIPNFDRERAKLVAQHQLELAVAIEEAVAKATEEERKYAAQNLQLILSNERAKLKAEFQDSLNKIVEERVEKALVSEKEKRHLAVKAELSTEKMTMTESFNEKLAVQLATQKETLLKSFESEKNQLIETWETAQKSLEEQNKRAQAELNALKTQTEKLKTRPWWHITAYDFVNIASNAFAFFGLINLYGAIGFLVSAVMIVSCFGIIQDLKKSHRTGWMGVLGIGVMETVYAYIHNVYFADLLKDKQHLGFDYHTVALASAVIISGLSTYVAIMTRLRATDDAELERIEEIDSQFKQQS
jgi:hypothetical protein